MSKQQHVSLHRKLSLRKRLLRSLDVLPGSRPAFYVPFIGDGDIACELYAPLAAGTSGRIFGADLDSVRVATAQSRLNTLLHATGDSLVSVKVANCDAWPFTPAETARDGEQLKFVLADLDAYSNPYPSFQAFVSHATLADRCVVFGTDGRLLNTRRNNRVPTFPTGTRPVEVRERQKVWNSYWKRQALPWLAGEAVKCGRTIKRSVIYRRDTMLYWGIVPAGEGRR